MSEVLEEVQVQVSAEQPSPFTKEAWVETPTTAVNIEEKKDEPIKTEIKEEIKIENKETVTEPFYKKLGFEKEEDVINEVTILREKASKVPEEIKWENEESKQIFESLKGGKKKEVLQALVLQDKLENLVLAEVNDDNATDIIKTGLRLKHKDLTDKEIDYKYNKQYSLPKEPTLDTDDDESVEKHNAWKEQVEDIKISRIIDAKTMKPELEKAKTEIKFPEIEKPQVEKANEPTPEMVQEMKETLINKLESDYSKVEGFSTLVKDESVEIPISFKIPDEEKAAIKSILAKDFDGDNFIGKRWFSENGEPNIEQMMSDIYLLANTDKVLSGVANKSANDRLLEFKKQIKNTDLNGITNQSTFQPNADGKNNLSPFVKEAWSEKPPAQLT